jgi:hypothetical protein
MVDMQRNRRVAPFSTDITSDALTIYRYDKASYQVAFLFRDTKQFAGWSDCQTYSQATLVLV